jgi:hypothetical protein
VVETMWMLRVLQDAGADSKKLARAFDIPHRGAIRDVMETALRSDLKTYYMRFGSEGKVRSQDISTLDPFSEEGGEADWGGLTEWSTAFASVIAETMGG